MALQECSKRHVQGGCCLLYLIVEISLIGYNNKCKEDVTYVIVITRAHQKSWLAAEKDPARCLQI